MFDSVIRSVAPCLHYGGVIERKKLTGTAECYGGTVETTEGGNDRQPFADNEAVSCRLFGLCQIPALSPRYINVFSI